MRKVICNYCGTDAKHVTGDVIYENKPELHHLWYWLCPSCGAYVGTHKHNHYKPYGRLADAHTRTKRNHAHRVFDKFWDTNVDRRKAYEELAEVLGISERDCHIGNFTQEMCNKVIKIFSNYSAWDEFCIRLNKESGNG